MKKAKVEFEGSLGHTLAGLLELPEQPPSAYVLFAHCFTCGKDIASASRISRALAERGFGVLRFDFTGLGGSDGDFANTAFSSNVADLVHAADFLRTNHLAPSLLIGHSLGGTAVLKAVAEIPEVRGVATIGAPADAAHVQKQLACDLDTIEREGQAEVRLAGRSFTIRREFLRDIRTQSMTHIAEMKTALLVLHSPRDTTVSIDEAEKIYRSARHPKSFISLDTADHLLTNREDARYVADTIAAWATRFVDGRKAKSSASRGIPRGEVEVTERNRAFTRGVASDDHAWLADEPVAMGGANLGPDPYEHLLAALGACTSMTIRMVANRQNYPLDSVDIRLRHFREHEKDCEDCEKGERKIDVIEREVILKGDLDEKQRGHLERIADRCPVHRTLHGRIKVRDAE
jgi:putative redox protein